MSLWPLASLFLCQHYFAELRTGRVIHVWSTAMLLVCATPAVRLVRHIYIYSFKRWGTFQEPRERERWHTDGHHGYRKSILTLPSGDSANHHSTPEVFRPYPTSNSSSWSCLNHLMRNVSHRQQRFLQEFLVKSSPASRCEIYLGC